VAARVVSAKVVVGLASVAVATAIVADQRRVKAAAGDSGWWDWNARAPASELARRSLWSHDSWAFGLGVLVPVALFAASVAGGKRRQ
jgi:hypothetical protein